MPYNESLWATVERNFSESREGVLIRDEKPVKGGFLLKVSIAYDRISKKILAEG